MVNLGRWFSERSQTIEKESQKVRTMLARDIWSRQAREFFEGIESDLTASFIKQVSSPFHSILLMRDWSSRVKGAARCAWHSWRGWSDGRWRPWRHFPR